MGGVVHGDHQRDVVGLNAYNIELAGHTTDNLAVYAFYFAHTLGRVYHEIVGSEHDATVRTIRHAQPEFRAHVRLKVANGYREKGESDSNSSESLAQTQRRVQPQTPNLSAGEGKRDLQGKLHRACGAARMVRPVSRRTWQRRNTLAIVSADVRRGGAKAGYWRG